MLDLGDTLTFSARLYDRDPAESGAVLVDSTSTVLTITLPDGTIVTPAVPAPSPTGTYEYLYVTTTQVGRYVGRWVFTMATGQTSSYSEVFDVQPGDPGYLISLRDAKRHLNIPSTSTSDDDEIRSWLAGITPVIEDLVGVCVPRTVTDEYHDNAQIMRLDETPVLSVTTILPWYTGGLTYAAAALRVDDDGRVCRLDGIPFVGGPFAVTYLAGRRPIPPNITQAAKIILGHVWATQRGASSLPLAGGDDTNDGRLGYSIPNRALELLRPDDLGPGVA